MIFFKHQYSAEDSSVVFFTALEDEKEIGKCTLLMNGLYAEVTELTYIKSCSYAVEGLIKAAFNLAANHNCYMGRCSLREIRIFLERMNFSRVGDVYENDIPTILMGSCGSCHNIK